MARRPNLSRAARQEQAVDFARCRTLRHGWEPIGAGDRRPEFGVLVCLRCIFCGTLRYDKFSPVTGERIGYPSYDWPEGYRGEHHDLSWWRASWAETISDVLNHPDDNVTPIKRKARRAS